GESIWMKIYATLGVENLLSNYSRIVYVDLIDPLSKIQATARIWLQNGLGTAEFQLADTLIEGTYRLRAYTNWMRNESPMYFYDELVYISNGRADQLLTKSFLREDGRFVVEFQTLEKQVLSEQSVFYEIVSPAGKRLKNGREKTNAMGVFDLPYKEEYAGAKLILQYQDKERALIEKVFKFPNPPQSENVVQFFPEGGDLLMGHVNRLAAKSLKPNGLGIASRTQIVTQGGDTIGEL